MVLDYRFTVKLNIYLMGYELTMHIPVLWAYRWLDTHWWVYILLDAHWPSIRYNMSLLLIRDILVSYNPAGLVYKTPKVIHALNANGFPWTTKDSHP